MIQQGAGSKTAKIAPHVASGISVGEHSLQVRAFDAAGNRDESPAVVQWRVLPVDTILVASPTPSVLPHSPVSFDVRSSSSKWAFEYRVDAGKWHLGSVYSSQAKAQAPWSSSLLQRTTVPKYTDHTRSERQTLSSGAEGHHTLEVRAFNDCGELGESVFASWRTTWVQTSVIHPPPTGTIASPNAEFVAEVGPSRPTFQWQLDGGAWNPPGNAKQQASAGIQGVMVPLEGLSDGPHSLRVRAVDYQGRPDSEPATFGWTVDTTPPATRLERVPLPNQSPAEAEFVWSCEDTTPCSYRYRLDGAEWVESGVGSVRLQALMPGLHTFSVAAIDAAGNIDPSPATHAWEVDTATPVTTIAQGPYKYSSERSAHFEFITSRKGCSLQYSLDGITYRPASHSLGMYDLPDGQHTLRVYATDAHGQVEPSPSVYTWVVDTQPPETVVQQWFFSPVERGVALFSVGIAAAPSGSVDPIFDYQYQVCSDACSEWLLGPKSARMGAGYELRVAGLAVGKHLVNVRASDRAGNTDPTPVAVEIHYEDAGSLHAAAPDAPSQASVNSVLDDVVAELTERGSDFQLPAAGHSRSLRHDSHNDSWLAGAPHAGDKGAGEERGYLSHLFAWITSGPTDVEPVPKAELRRRYSLRREL